MDTLQPAPPPPRRAGLLLGVGIGLVVVALVGLAIFLIPRLLNSTAATVNVTAAAMPADTQFYVSLNPHFSALPNGDIVLKAWGNSDAIGSLEEDFLDGLRDVGVDWERDIAAWLGDEVGFGVGNLPLDSNRASETPPAYVMAVATRDQAKSDALLAKWRAEREADDQTFDERTYRDVSTVEQVDTAPGEGAAYATLKDLVLFANGPDALHAAIDALLDGNGLDQSTAYQTTSRPLRGGRALTAYFDAGPLFKSLFEQLQDAGNLPSGTASDEGMLRSLETLQGVAFGLSFENNGPLLDLILSADVSQLSAEDQATYQAPANPNRLLGAVPDSTFIYFGSQLVADTIDAAFKNLGATDPNFEDSLRRFENQTGLDLRADLLDLLTGEFAVVATPGAGLSAANPVPFGFALLLETADKQRVEENVNKMIGAVIEDSDQTIEDVTVGDAHLHGVQNSFSETPNVVYGLLGDHFVLTLAENTAKRIADAADSPLSGDDDFKAATAPLPKDNTGYFYLKPKNIIDLLSLGLGLSGQECTACPWFEPVRAVAFAVQQPSTEVGLTRANLFVLLDVDN